MGCGVIFVFACLCDGLNHHLSGLIGDVAKLSAIFPPVEYDPESLCFTLFPIHETPKTQSIHWPDKSYTC